VEEILAKANLNFTFILPPAKAGGNSNGNQIWDNHLNRNAALAHSTFQIRSNAIYQQSFSIIASLTD
jgi:hypothetical protein